MYSINDKVKVSQFYQEKYPSWDPGTGVITQVLPSKQIRKLEITVEDGSRSRFKDYYGDIDTYQIESFLVKFEKEEYPRLCSVFGLDLI